MYRWMDGWMDGCPARLFGLLYDVWENPSSVDGSGVEVSYIGCGTDRLRAVERASKQASKQAV